MCQLEDDCIFNNYTNNYTYIPSTNLHKQSICKRESVTKSIITNLHLKHQ